jgi:hypothetical protein
MPQPPQLGPGRALRHFDVVIPQLALSAFGRWPKQLIPSPVHRQLQGACRSAGKLPRHNLRKSADR